MMIKQLSGEKCVFVFVEILRQLFKMSRPVSKDSKSRNVFSFQIDPTKTIFGKNHRNNAICSRVLPLQQFKKCFRMDL